ncbi:alpha-amylase family protein [Maribellus maritimus]|uniref:hypothetical protein n=1 Tax=Maribellus maritimus TaxID=2870838 RepID=UPI001EEA6EC8|nr:hypothetical protein [Maribellus maritimus]MCG6189377.1 hypothetical protein [Maribellus maritimus]
MKNYILGLIKIIVIITLLTPPSLFASDLPTLNNSFKNAKAHTKRNQLIVSTGEIERSWVWTGKGLSTIQIKNNSGEVVATNSDTPADWDFGDLGEGKLISLKAFRDDDEHFTSEHLTIVAEIKYSNIILKYEVWAYPDAPGLRTQVWLKTPSGKKMGDGTLAPGISESIKLADKQEKVTAFGYQAGLKADVKPYEILTTENIPENGSSEITSGLIAAGRAGGLILLKESQIHTDMHEALETGGFERKESQLFVTGLGLCPNDLEDNEYKFCWANWLVLYQGNELDAQMQIKRFDRIRYPVHPDRDVFIMANTWGSEDKQDQCWYKAREENVLTEIEVCAELGIDILQIDDGWQIRKGEDSWLPAAKGPTQSYKNSELPQLLDGTLMPESYDIYPDGFGKVRETAKEKGIRLGLWNAWTAPLNTLKANYDAGDFKSFKLDFAVLHTKEALDNLYYKARDLIKYSNYSAVVNWDVTERAPRMGFYFGRDCGNLYLANRKAYTIRPSVQYEPWQVLRDGWELASYMNLNKVQLTFQNKDLTPPEAITDALKYSHAYNFAITLMSSPIFFTELQFLSPEARAELKPIIAKYKAERDEMYKGYVFAIGDKPDNKSWTGFQNYNPETGNGYLTVFRELNNNEKSKSIELKFLENKKIELYNLLTGEKRILTQSGSSLLFSSDIPASFLFYRYKILN